VQEGQKGKRYPAQCAVPDLTKPSLHAILSSMIAVNKERAA
jgi:hypothetical protein